MGVAFSLWIVGLILSVRKMLAILQGGSSFGPLNAVLICQNSQWD